MNELSLDGFRHTIRENYGSECQLVGRERVDEPVRSHYSTALIPFAFLSVAISLVLRG
jgi:hypothetical protein